MAAVNFSRLPRGRKTFRVNRRRKSNWQKLNARINYRPPREQIRVLNNTPLQEPGSDLLGLES